MLTHRIHEDLLYVPVEDAGAARNGYLARGYAMLLRGKAVLVDISASSHLPALRELREDGTQIAALVLTHRHLVHADALKQFEEELGIPIFLHPADAARCPKVEARLQDPTQSTLLADLGIEVIPFPGHTAGHVLLYRQARGGILFTGDSAMGPNLGQSLAGTEIALRPPLDFSEDDEKLREQWEAFDRPVATFLPLHGAIFLDRADDMPAIMAPLRRREPTPAFTA